MSTQTVAAEEPGPGDLWVRSSVSAEGTYVATVEAGPDVAFALDPDAAVRYARHAMSAVARAEYDAAVLAQLLGTGLDLADVWEVVRGLRSDRPPLSTEWPVTFEPIVSARTNEPVITMLVNGKPDCQLGTGALTGHAVDVLEISHGVDLDAAYRRHLVAIIGLDDATARATVAGLGDHIKRS